MGRLTPRARAIREIEEAAALGTLVPERIEAFLAAHRFPLVEGPSSTFVWRGEADEVRLRHWIYALPSTQAFRRISGTDLWHLTLELPANSRIEYKLEVRQGSDTRLVEDPFNPQRSRDPFGANSVLHTEGYQEPEWTRFDPESRPGALEDFALASRSYGRECRATLYVPARFRRTRRYPLLVVHDGGDFLHYAGLKTVLDNLIHRLEIPELLVVMLHPGERLVEYADDPRHARFLAEELWPALESRFPLMHEPAGRGLLGASFGGVASLAAAWRYPGFYGRLLLLSGSFAFTDIGEEHRRGPLFDPVVPCVNAFRADPRRPAERWFVSCGVYESLIYENRSLLPLLQAANFDLRYVEARDGHNWENWRDRLREGLSFLFPGPLWMVYE